MRKLTLVCLLCVGVFEMCFPGIVKTHVRTLHILSIGINRYTFPNQFALMYSEADAISLAAALGKLSPNVRTHVLLTSNATKRAMQDSVEAIVSEAGPSDTFVFFFAGFSKTKGESDLYLIPFDATTISDDALLEAQAVSGELLKTWFSRIPAKDQLLILDAGPNSLEALHAMYEQDNARVREYSRRNTVMFSSHPYGIEIREQHHGLLTYCLLKGLEGGAGFQGGYITARGLEAFAGRKMLEYGNTSGTQTIRIQSYIVGSDFDIGIAGMNSVSASPSTRGVSVDEVQPQVKPPSGQGRSRQYALLFATDQYESWKPLVNPVNDAQTIARELRDSYGFEIEMIQNAARDSIEAKLTEYVGKSFGETDELMIFFAGHGDFREELKQGYVVAKDSKSRSADPLRRSYLKHTDLRDLIDQVPCKHILVVLDVCFGGTFDGFIAYAGSRGDDEYTEVSREKYLERKKKFKSRIYLTSGGKEYVPDGRPGQHSPFARKFIEALRTSGGKDGILTFSEIREHVDKVDPQPRAGEFGSNEPGGDFVFVVK